MTNPVIIEWWQDPVTTRYCFRLRKGDSETITGRCYPLRADCMGAIERIISTDKRTPIKMLKAPPKSYASEHTGPASVA